jgi:hypothetical protein
MSRSRKTAVRQSISRHTSTSWQRSAGRTFGPWVTLSTRALWFNAARAGAVEARRCSRVCGVRTARLHVQWRLCHVSCTSLFSCLWLSPYIYLWTSAPLASSNPTYLCLHFLASAYLSTEATSTRCPISHPNRFATRSVFLSPPLGLVSTTT